MGLSQTAYHSFSLLSVNNASPGLSKKCLFGGSHLHNQYIFKQFNLVLLEADLILTVNINILSNLFKKREKMSGKVLLSKCYKAYFIC